MVSNVFSSSVMTHAAQLLWAGFSSQALAARQSLLKLIIGHSAWRSVELRSR